MNDNSAFVAVRLKVLPRRHRIAHLRALVRLGPKEPRRREELLDLHQAEVPGVSAD
ncbi:MAG: hypothetical protein ACRED3_12550 [Bradyrhizobium sp.]